VTEAALYSALAFAASAGVATFFAPCAFPLLPGYVGYYVDRHRADDTGLAAALVGALGAVLALGTVSALATAFGRTVTASFPALEVVVGVGLLFAGVLSLAGDRLSISVPLPSRPESRAGFGVFGAGYALAAAGCVGPFFLGVVGNAVALSTSGAVLVLGTYVLTMAAPLVGVTLLASAGVESWRSLGTYSERASQIAAVVMIAAGVGQLYLVIVVLDVV
jgi:cytochrome c-type biogenesis protein